MNPHTAGVPAVRPEQPVEAADKEAGRWGWARGRPKQDTRGQDKGVLGSGDGQVSFILEKRPLECFSVQFRMFLLFTKQSLVGANVSLPDRIADSAPVSQCNSPLGCVQLNVSCVNYVQLKICSFVQFSFALSPNSTTSSLYPLYPSPKLQGTSNCKQLKTKWDKDSPFPKSTLPLLCPPTHWAPYLFSDEFNASQPPSLLHSSHLPHFFYINGFHWSGKEESLEFGLQHSRKKSTRRSATTASLTFAFCTNL